MINSKKLTLQNLVYGIIAIILILLGGGVFTFFKIDDFSRKTAEQNALNEAERSAETLKSFRGLYTSEVITNAISKGKMNVSHDYTDIKYDTIGGAIPLPATMTIMLADKMTTNNSTVKLYSKYPFPWRKDRKLTEFEVRAYEYFEANRDNDEPFYEFDQDNNLLRYAIPDKMVVQSCVNCHNSHPQTPRVGWQLGDVRGAISIERPILVASAEASVAGDTIFTIGTIVVVIFVVLFIVIQRIRNVNFAIDKTKKALEQLEVGDLPEKELDVPNNELEEVVTGLNVLTKNFQRVTSFAENIGNGNLEAQFDKLSEKDSLGDALITMRNNLKELSEQEAQRNWTTTGLAQLSETLHSSYDKPTDLYDRLISFLIRYTKSNQCGMYLLNDDDRDNPKLDLVACYAYDRKKHLTQSINLGEGLVGQCFLEQQMIHMTKLPPDYIRITSGLGGAVPSCLLIIPLLVNNNIYGVLEIASFNAYEEHEIEFLNKVGETIASTLATVRSAVHTKALLAQAQQQAEEMRAQEEEMRQNVEEMQATQEEFYRREKEYQEEIQTYKTQLVSNGNGKAGQEA